MEMQFRDNNNYESPISHIAQDHLFSIFLLLPVNSILAFALTCKKFNSFVCSNTLWHSICTRDWGSICVESLKSWFSDENGRTHVCNIPWFKVYQQVAQLGSVSCLKLSDSIGSDELLPCPRASHSLNFVSDCLVLFGGGCEGGRHRDDTWVAYLGYNLRKVSKWEKVTSGFPSGRFGHTCVVTGNFIVLFGGINDHGIRQNDTWIGKIVHHETLGITFYWTSLDVGSIAPPPRGAHAGCCIENKRMLIHGGIGLDGIRLGDMWILEISENFLNGSWREIQSHPTPQARSGHSLTCIDGKRTVLFGGRGLGYDVLDDVWLFDISEDGLPKWVQVVFNIQNIPEGISLRRVGHSATLILGGGLLIYGGEDSERRRKDDFWLLDVKSIPLISKIWRKVKSHGYKPNSRSFHSACSDRSGRYVFVFGGMVDGVVQPEGPSGLRFDGDIFLVELFLPLAQLI